MEADVSGVGQRDRGSPQYFLIVLYMMSDREAREKLVRAMLGRVAMGEAFTGDDPPDDT